MAFGYDLKSESEVKEYLKNLGIEYRFGCFSEKKPEVCHLLGDYLEAIKRDFSKAAKVYQNNCDDYKYPKSCYKFGAYSLLGKGLPKEDFQQAFRYFERGCNLDSPESCLHQGMMMVTQNKETTIKRDVVNGMKILNKACDGNNASACYYLSGMYISGVKREDNSGKKTGTQGEANDDYLVQKNMEQAFKYALKGCELGNIYSCANVSQMYSRGDGTPKNAELSDKYKKIALQMQQEILETQKTLSFGQGLPNK